MVSETRSASGATAAVTYTYDHNGNLLSKNAGSPATTVQNTYNDLNQLVQTTVGGVSTNYAYDINGLRSAKNDTTYLYDGNDLVVEMQNGTVVGRYMYGLALNSAVIDGEDVFYLRNAHGDVAMLTNMYGGIIKTYDYDAFGNEINPDPNDANPLRYAGEYYDKETGTYYLRARYYDPIIGRFTQEDAVRGVYRTNPYGQNLVDSLSLNLYVYCGNNPVLYVDPSGNRFERLTRAYVKSKVHPLFTFATQVGAFSELFDIAGFTRDSDSGVYHAKQNALQRYAGYNDLYDFAFYYGTSMEREKFEFTSGSQDYVFWAWKGDYLNLGAGAELGVYKRYEINGIKTNHWIVDTNLALPMTLTLQDKSGNQILSYAPSEKQWWVTGFNPFYQHVNAESLTAIYTVSFSGREAMYGDFYKRHYEDNRWTFNESNYTAKFVFD